MIEKMLKVYCAVRSEERDCLLNTLRKLGVIHLLPVDPGKAVAGEKTAGTIDRFKRALQVLAGFAPVGEAPDVSSKEAVSEILKIQKSMIERESRLTSLHRQVEKLAIWGDVKLEQFEAIRKAGIDLHFYSVPEKLAGEIKAECLQEIGDPLKGKSLVAVINRKGQTELPEGVEEIPIPKTDRPSIREEAARIDAAIQEDKDRLALLANLKGNLQTDLKKFEEEARFNIALGGALSDEKIFAVQGWIPAKKEAMLSEGLSAEGLEVGIRTSTPDEDDDPPTLISYPKLIKPIKGLFEILGTLPGYREFDLAPFFMVAMPLFAAILIGDAGYGLIFIVASLLLRKKAAAMGAGAKVQLLLVFGAVTFIWGLLSGTFFGLGPIDFLKAGGMWEGVGKAFNSIVIIGHISAHAIETALNAADPHARLKALDILSGKAMDGLQNGLMMFSFIIAILHLLSARIREIIALAPDQRALASLGWAMVLCGMFFVIWIMFFNPDLSTNLVYGFLIPGLVLTVGFSVPSKNIFKRLSLGVASSLLPTVGAFSDLMSYIRLMAVAMASVFIGQVFNMLGAQLADVATWAAGAPVVLFGHTLNIALCMIAIFAHGVRLNMLEFSNNAGVQWGGHPYEPFVKLKD